MSRIRENETVPRPSLTADRRTAGVAWILIVAWGVFATAAFGEGVSGDDETISVATRYLEALYAADFDALEGLTSERLEFHDPTSAQMPSGPWRFQGREAVLAFFRSSMEGVESTGFDVLRAFSSGGKVVLDLTYHSTGSGEPFGAPDAEITLAVPAVTILTIDEAGRVVEHEDLVDYRVLMGQVERQLAAARAELPPPRPSEKATEEDAAQAESVESAFPRPDAARVAELEGLARSFLEAIWSFDEATMAQMLHPDALYEDYTADYFGIEPYSFRGPRDILDFYRRVNADSGTQHIAPTIRELFVAGSNVVVLIDVQVVMDGDAWGAPGRTLTGGGLTVAWLRFDGDKVSRHVDYADYDHAIRQFEAQALAPAAKP